jgi:hypothetical protein
VHIILMNFLNYGTVMRPSLDHYVGYIRPSLDFKLINRRRLRPKVNR